MLDLDGSAGEGGGQILRSALALSIVTGQPFAIDRIRAGRKNPGLQRQHLAAVEAAAAVGKAEVQGAAVGSRSLVFRPSGLAPGRHRFAVGSAGSATLVLQTILPPLLLAREPSTLELEGGTHNPWAPPFDFLERAFLPLLARMGAEVTAVCERRGFYPAGGGKVRVGIRPAGKLAPLELLERGPLKSVSARAIVSALSARIAKRELGVLGERLTLDCAQVVEEKDPRGPGNVVLVEVESAGLTEVFTGFGEKGVPAERVAGGVAGEVERYLAEGVPVGEHLADQLLLPLALAGGGAFVTGGWSGHTATNLDVIAKFLPVRFGVSEAGDARRIAVTS
jgi:RNA 3'-terminal phosphate cyclase (ATP)